MIGDGRRGTGNICHTNRGIYIKVVRSSSERTLPLKGLIPGDQWDFKSPLRGRTAVSAQIFAGAALCVLSDDRIDIERMAAFSHFCPYRTKCWGTHGCGTGAMNAAFAHTLCPYGSGACPCAIIRQNSNEFCTRRATCGRSFLGVKLCNLRI